MQEDVRIVATEDVLSVRLLEGVIGARDLEFNDSKKTAFAFDQDPVNLTLPHFRQILVACSRAKCHDITIKSGEKIRAKIRGNQYLVTRRPIHDGEVDQILVEIYGAANARSEVNSGKALDFSFEIRMEDGKIQRFRVNVTGVFGGIEITMRFLSRETPTREMVGLDDRLLEAMSPENGMVLIVGETGSGKSTLMAALLREFLLSLEHTYKITDFQAPTEYTFSDIMALPDVVSTIGCSEIGRNLASFSSGVHTALRRNPDIICVGESRDQETIRASLLASITGHILYTTTHAGSVPEAVMRMLSEFPAAEQGARANELATALRMIVVQRLVMREDGSNKFIPVREYLRVTPRLRDRLLATPISEWQSLLFDEVSGRVTGLGPDDMHQSTKEHVKQLAKQKILSVETARLIANSSEITTGDT